MPFMSRVWLYVAALALVSSGYGSWLGIGPTWPDQKVWAAFAWVAAAAAFFHAARPSGARLRGLTSTLITLGILRIAGFALFASSPASRWSGMGGWALIVSVALLAHRGERRALR